MLADYNKIPDDNSAESLDVPVQSAYEWRTFVFLLAFIALILIVSQRTGSYRYVLPSFLIYIALIFILNRKKVSVGNGTLKIGIPFSRDIIIPKNSISNMEILENIGSRHKFRNLSGLILALMLQAFLAFTIEGPIWTNLFIISTFLFIYTLYFSVRIYNNTKIIKISSGDRAVLLYPRNEHDFLILKGIADSKPI